MPRTRALHFLIPTLAIAPLLACPTDPDEPGDELADTDTSEEDASDSSTEQESTDSSEDSSGETTETTEEESTEGESTGTESTEEESTDTGTESTEEESTDTGTESTEEESTDTETETGTETDTDTDTGGMAECADFVLDGLPAMTMGNSADATDDYSLCMGFGGTGALDVSFEWTAPKQGLFTIDTVGSDFDTVLGAKLGTCADEEPWAACNNNLYDVGDVVDPDSRIQVGLQEGESVTLYLDGRYASSVGDYQLTIDELECPAPEVLDGPFPVEGFGSIDWGDGLYTGSCGGAGEELAFSWTAPEAGLYAIDTFGSDDDTVLYVRDEACWGPELGCNDDAEDDVTSQLFLDLEANQTIFIVLDVYAQDFSGNFEVHINPA